MKTKLFIQIILLALVVNEVYCQNNSKLANKISRVAPGEFQRVENLFSVDDQAKGRQVNPQLSGKEVQHLKYNSDAYNKIIAAKPDFLSLSIPVQYAGENEVQLYLEKVSSTYSDYVVRMSNEPDKTWPSQTNQLHYRGVIKGEEQSSVVSLSVYEDHVTGILSVHDEASLNIGRASDGAISAFFDDQIVPHDHEDDETCMTSGSFQNAKLDGIYSQLSEESPLATESLASTNTHHLEVYIEVDFDIYQHFSSSTTQVENYVTGMFNEVATLYDNEDITIEISEIFIWNSNDGYSSSVSTGLNDFVAARPNFNGDLAHLLSFRSGNSDPNNTSNAGGIANGIGGLCVDGNSNLSPHSHTALFPEFETFPVFSRQVKVVAHEMGHNLGSRHTHACVWNGNNTAIDGCANGTEGSCSTPGYPSAGGTIMSYCDRRSVGIDFNLGFGNQPGDVIRTMITNATCVVDPSCVGTLNLFPPSPQNNTVFGTVTHEANEINFGFAPWGARVASTANVTMIAGTRIVLKNVHIEPGATFHASINPNCPSGDFTTDQGDEVVTADWEDEATSEFEDGEFKLYPNPAENTVNIQCAFSESAVYSVEIYDLRGALLIQQGITPVNNGIDISRLNAGLYSVMLLEATGHETRTIGREKLIIQ